MALCKLSNEIVSIRGRFGGVYFKKDNAGQHVQAMPRHVHFAKMDTPKTRSPNPGFSLASGISAWTGMAAIWLMALLLGFSAVWAVYALTHYFIDKDGVKKRLHGYNWFMHYAMTLTFPETTAFPMWEPPPQPRWLPDWLVTYNEGWIYKHRIEDWPDEVPAAQYFEIDDWNGKASWQSRRRFWNIWYNGVVYVISPIRGMIHPTRTYFSPFDVPGGLYTNPFSGSTARVHGIRQPHV